MENNALLRYWTTHSMRNLHVTLAVVAVGALVVARLSGNDALLAVSDVVALLDILHFFIHGYFYHQHRFLTDYLHTYSLPKKKIARLGAGFFAGFLVFVCVGMAVVREIYTGTLLAKLKAMVLYVLGLVFGALLESDGLGEGELLLQDNNDLLGVMNQFAPKEQAPWEKVINSIQSVLIVVGVVLLLAVIVMAVVSAVRRSISGVRIEGGADRAGQTSDREESLGRTRKKRDNPLDRSPTARIRRSYRKAVNRQRRGLAVPGWMTPAEIEGLVAFPDAEPYRQLHTVYEKARYSEGGCTEEDLQHARTLQV